MEVAFTVTFPLSNAETIPELLTDASPTPFAIDQVTVLFVAVAGKTSASNCSDPLSVVIVVTPPVPVRVIPLTFIT